jgi:long-chain acyl-CoA synthetase
MTIKLRSGALIAPEKLESIYVQSYFIENIFIHAEPDMSHAVAIINPSATELSKRFPNTPLDQLCRDKEVATLILDDLHEIAKAHRLKAHEKVLVVKLVAHRFTTENGLLTSLFKVNRREAKKYFKKDLQALSAASLNKSV